MRTLVIGIPLPHVSFDNYSFISAPSFADYRRMIVEPESVSRVVQEVVEGTAEHLTFTRQPVANAASSAKSFGLADLLAMRARESERFLANGGLLVCFAHPDVAVDGIEGQGRWNRYGWLPAHSDAQYSQLLLPEFGTQGAQVTDEDHPFAPYGDSFAPRTAYRACLNEDLPLVRDSCRIFMRSPGGLAIGGALPLGQGSLIVLPPLADPQTERTQTAEALFQCFERWQNVREAALADDERNSISVTTDAPLADKEGS